MLLCFSPFAHASGSPHPLMQNELRFPTFHEKHLHKSQTPKTNLCHDLSLPLFHQFFVSLVKLNSVFSAPPDSIVPLIN
jgi:hypothetical protein